MIRRLEGLAREHQLRLLKSFYFFWGGFIRLSKVFFCRSSEVDHFFRQFSFCPCFGESTQTPIYCSVFGGRGRGEKVSSSRFCIGFGRGALAELFSKGLGNDLIQLLDGHSQGGTKLLFFFFFFSGRERQFGFSPLFSGEGYPPLC